MTFHLEVKPYEEHYVAFIDILGYSALVENSEFPIDVAIIQAIMKSFKGTAETTSPIDCCTFSDSMFLASDDLEQLLRFLCYLQFYMFSTTSTYKTVNIVDQSADTVETKESEPNVALFRGAVVYGKTYIEKKTDDNNIGSVSAITGSAVVKAVHLEEKKVIYPRVIVDESVFLGPDKDKLDRFHLYKADDGLTSIDYIGYFDDMANGANRRSANGIQASTLIIKKQFMDTCNELIEKYKQEGNDRVRVKYEWLKKYLEDAGGI